MPAPQLLAVPNISEGRDATTIAAVRRAFESDGVRLLDVHTDPDHHRSVFTLAGAPTALVGALVAGARVAVELIDVVARARSGADGRGQHPHIGALDVAPVVHLDDSSRGAACAAALVLADRIGSELRVPVFLYGELTDAGESGGRTRAELRRGGVRALSERMRAGASQSARDDRRDPAAARTALAPDFGPREPHPSAGATLVAARPPLVAFNLQLAPPAALEDAQRIAAAVREGAPEGLPGVRAIGVLLRGNVAQVSLNVERPFDVPLAAVLEAVAQHAPVASAELVGLAPRAALHGFPGNVEIVGFDPARQLVENALG